MICVTSSHEGATEVAVGRIFLAQRSGMLCGGRDDWEGGQWCFQVEEMKKPSGGWVRPPRGRAPARSTSWA